MELTLRIKVWASVLIACVAMSAAVGSLIECGHHYMIERSIAAKMSSFKEYEDLLGIGVKPSYLINEGRDKAKGISLRNSGNRTGRMNAFSWLIYFVIALVIFIAAFAFLIWVVTKDKDYINYLRRKANAFFDSEKEKDKRRVEAQPYLDRIYLTPEDDVEAAKAEETV